jgi:hypothetical protein
MIQEEFQLTENNRLLLALFAEQMLNIYTYCELLRF